MSNEKISSTSYLRNVICIVICKEEEKNNGKSYAFIKRWSEFVN